MVGIRGIACILAASLFCLAACQQTTPRLTDEQVASLREGLPGISEQCLQMARDGGVEAIPSAVDQCFKMTPSQHWHGLWRDDFEGRRFCPAPARQCSIETPGPKIWPRFKDEKRPIGNQATGKLYAVEFIGRRTQSPGAHGHMAQSEHAILIDQLLAISPVD
ncbi:hypothetical protein AB2M62_12980 [Sphingomonas sp. MMS12-HWE2-04]|uniref:hypothetical protein n=1 Tax=Sphingomonas sp. MMS12-HWE2-04 TaxID=3234199 RepID=UPI00384D55AD